jgi:hypothetical protein
MGGSRPAPGSEGSISVELRHADGRSGPVGAQSPTALEVAPSRLLLHVSLALHALGAIAIGWLALRWRFMLLALPLVVASLLHDVLRLRHALGSLTIHCTVEGLVVDRGAGEGLYRVQRRWMTAGCIVLGLRRLAGVGARRDWLLLHRRRMQPAEYALLRRHLTGRGEETC